MSDAPASPPLPEVEPALAPGPRPPVFGLIGGIGSGKSAVARWVAARDPSFPVFDADAAGHAALRDARIVAGLRATFGDGVLCSDGSIDRREIAARVFGTGPDAAANRRALERLVHPHIEQAFERFRDEHRGSTRGLLLDAAVLLEAGWDRACDRIIFLDAPEAQRRRRALERGWTHEEFTRREASQLPLDVKRARADVCIANGETLDIAGRQVYEYVQRWIPDRH